MSYTTVLNVIIDNDQVKIDDIKELRNSHGSAPPVWDSMCQKYFGTEPHGYMHNGTLDLLWPRYKDLSIPEHQRAVLMMTYDKCYVAKKNFKRAASDIRKFLTDFPPIEGNVNHWDEIAKIYESDPDADGIGLHCTSVSENPFEGEWNEENEDYELLDADEIFEIYAELNSLTNTTGEPQ